MILLEVATERVACRGEFPCLLKKKSKLMFGSQWGRPEATALLKQLFCKL